MFNEILKTISEFDRIILHRHSHPDGDAIGSQLGLYHLIKDNFGDKEVYKVGDDASRFAFLEGSAPEEIPDSYYDGALAIILDCGAAHMISDERYSLAKKTIRFDHHLFCENVADIDCVDSTYESCCGLVAMFAKQTGLNLSLSSATALYLGMVTDSGRFQFESVTGDTLRLAGLLLDKGIDTQTMFANLYMQDYGYFKFKAYVYEHMQTTENGVVYIYVDKEMQEEFNLSREDASAVIGELSNVKGSLIWLAFIDNADGSIRVRLRSRFLKINLLAGKYHGGGHEMASGATVYSQEEMRACIDDADALLKEYKQNNTGWL